MSGLREGVLEPILLNAQEAARFLALRVDDIYNLTSSKELPFVQRGIRGKRWYKQDLVSWVERNRRFV